MDYGDLISLKGMVRDIEKSTGLDADLDVWQAQGYDTRIDYSRAAMAELAIAATEGFNRMAHGGVEVGGVLYGLRDADGVKILGHRPLPCEYALGPSFTLSDNDRRALEDLLALPQTDRELSGMQAVGWYHSHTRSEILLSEKDLALYQRYFPEPWQVALVLRPHRFDPVRAGFFFREPDGSVHAASTRREFIIQEGVAKVPLPAAQVVAPVQAEAPVPPAVPAPIRSVAKRRPAPQRWLWYAAAAAVAVLLAGLLFWIGNAHNPAGLSLHALDLGGQLRIDWNCEPNIVRQSESGELEIQDGSRKVLNALSRDQLHAGSITYSRTSGNVLARITVHGTDKSALTQMVRFLGPPVATAAPANAPPPQPVASPPAVALPPAVAPPPAIASADRMVEKVKVETPQRAPEPERRTPPPPAPAPRRLVLPAASAPAPPDPSVPTPPAIAVNSTPPLSTFVPHLPAPVSLPGAVAAPSKTVDQGPVSGKMIWTGKLARRGTIQISGGRATPGSLTGGLPGAPVRVHVYPAELTQDGVRIFTADPRSVSAPEAPGAQNGWNRTVYVLNPKQAADITIVEAPGQQNAWNRIVLRAEHADHSIIVLRWERVPASTPQP